MGLRRAGVAFFALVFLVALLPVVSHAQTSLEEAEDRRESAYTLLAGAVANRAETEARLLAALEEYQRLSALLAEKAASVDRLGELVGTAGSELARVTARVDALAADAYMEALSLPAGVVFDSKNVQQALIRQPMIQLLAGDEEDRANTLIVSRRNLDQLRSRMAGEMAEVSTLQMAAEAAADNLEALFAEADRAVGVAIGRARAADRAFLAELDRVERAQAAAAEQERQSERSTTTTTEPSPVVTSTSTPTTSTSLPPPPSIGTNPIKPTVERWRGVVSAYFQSAWVEPALRIIQCESLGDPEAYNPYSGASGLFQFLPGTWAVISSKAGFGGASAFDPEANIGTAAWLAAYYQSLGRNPWTPWYCTP
ncbi:MAG TPA: transglycosylase SLT domain-containing protein [Acidimicrobiia bacterium]|nr:transglycosylase SLT domain-containing protein [Acidimicrobiia bacterium]